MLNFRTFLLDNSFSVSRSFWMADLLSHLLNGAAIWCKLDESALMVSWVRMWNPTGPRTHACCTSLVTCLQAQDVSFILPLKPNHPGSFQTPVAHPSRLPWMQEYYRRQCQSLANVQINTIHWRKVFLENSMIFSVTKVWLTGLYSPGYAFGLFWRQVQNLLSSRP